MSPDDPVGSFAYLFNRRDHLLIKTFQIQDDFYEEDITTESNSVIIKKKMY